MRVYDGKIFKEITYTPIFNENLVEDVKLPTGHFIQTNQKITTEQGIWLDKHTGSTNPNKDLLRNRVQDIMSHNDNAILTDNEKINYFFMRRKHWSHENLLFNDFYEALLNALGKIGLVNEVDLDETIDRITFTMSTKNQPTSEFFVYFYPLDSVCYSLLY